MTTTVLAWELDGFWRYLNVPGHALGAFLVSPGAGGLAAVIAAGIALYVARRNSRIEDLQSRRKERLEAATQAVGSLAEAFYNVRQRDIRVYKPKKKGVLIAEEVERLWRDRASQRHQKVPADIARVRAVWVDPSLFTDAKDAVWTYSHYSWAFSKGRKANDGKDVTADLIDRAEEEALEAIEKLGESLPVLVERPVPLPGSRFRIWNPRTWCSRRQSERGLIRQSHNEPRCP